MPTIRLEEVAKLYKGNGRRFAAVLNVDLKIEQGEFVFFVGSRGAGTSTLLSLISGEIQPERGSVYLDEFDLSKGTKRYREKLRRNFGIVPQEPQLIRTRTVFENLNEKRRIEFFGSKSASNEALIQKALGLVGMAGCEGRYPLEFSIAECRRIELAKAILYSPPILILDGITDRMDDESIWDTMQLLHEMNIRGTTVLMATHAKQFVNIMRKRVITLVDGRIYNDAQKGKYGDVG